MIKKILLFAALSLLWLPQLKADVYFTTASKSEIFDKPSSDGKVIGSLTPGYRLDVDMISNGFARFNYIGKTGYIAIKNIRKANPEEAPPPMAEINPPRTPVVSIAPVNRQKTTLYLFFDEESGIKDIPISFNSSERFSLEGKKLSGKKNARYTRSMRKVIAEGCGTMDVSVNITRDGTTYRAEIPLAITDGSTYYLKITTKNMDSRSRKKKKSVRLQKLSAKEGLKLLRNRKFTRNSDMEIFL